MRKGKLVIIEKTTIKAGDTCFDTVTKHCIEIMKIDDAGVFSRDKITGAPQNVIKQVGLPAGRFVELVIQDEVISEEVFPLDPAQQDYVYRNESRHHLKFFTAIHGDQHIAIVLAKNIHMQSMINRMAPMANMYGQYVAQQKSINEPAKSFDDWFFSVSI